MSTTRATPKRVGRSPTILLACALVTACVAARGPVEATMALHMGVQLPLLATAGWLVAVRTPRAWDPHGIAGLLLASAVMAAWMVPRALDAAVESPVVDGLKVASVVAAGALAAGSWRRAPLAVRLFVAGNAGWMLATAGVLLAGTPSRLCVSYAQADQGRAGAALVALAALLAAAVAWPLVRPAPSPHH